MLDSVHHAFSKHASLARSNRGYDHYRTFYMINNALLFGV
jgi:hypothetical protein